MKNLFLFILFAFSSMSFAGQFNDATIDSVVIDKYGIVRITLQGGTQTNEKPSCSTSNDGKQFTYDLNGPSGAGWHALVLSAHVTQSRVHVIGNNSCLALWNSTAFESVNSLYLLK